MQLDIKHFLPIPFPGRAVIQVTSDLGMTPVEAELGISDIEIFQAASYRWRDALIHPLVLQFGNPAVQQYCLHHNAFPVEQILVEYGTDKVLGVQLLNARQADTEGQFMQAYAGLSCLILALPGFAEKHRIEPRTTFITLKTLNYAH
jgi:hypothetical protein